jgi:exopolysaccharide biosynthesis WecB/TagA/CpsF family protein
MKIAVDASRATRAVRTGTETYARHVIERLVTLEQARGVCWTRFFQEEPGDWLAGLPAVSRRVLPRPRMWTYSALAPTLLRQGFDAIWVPSHVLPPTAPLRRIPSLVTVHDLGYEHFPAAHTLVQRAYLRLTTRYHARAATRITADSYATRRDLIQMYGADPEKISVVHLGVDHDRFRPVADPLALETVRARYHTGKRFILHVGTLQPRKNLNRLLRAFATVARELPDVTLVLAGAQGWLAGDLEESIRHLGIDERVVLPGYVAGEDLPALLSAAELFVLPSLFEGFGLPVLEAMACGTPVFTSNTSSLPEVAGDAALLVDPLDKTGIARGIHLLLTQTALRAALRERGLAQAQAFTWDRTAGQILDLLLDIAHARAPVTRQAPPVLTARSEFPSPSCPRAPASATSHARISLLGVTIHNLSWQQTLESIQEMIQRARPHQLVTVNPEFLMRARREPDFLDVLRRADLVLPDGVGLLLAARWKGQRFQTRVTGSDLVPVVAREAARQGWRLYLLGAAPGVAEAAARRLRETHPELDVIADGSDPAPDGPPDLLERIRAASPDILLVAYGAPKQDLWIDRFGKQAGVPVQIGIGGSLDFVAGVVPRAPEQWQRLGVEWLWRLKEEPWRWRRMLALPRFALLAALEAMRERLSL